MINAFSQLGNVAGSYVWNLKDNGFRKSYGIVLSMFGITIVGVFAFRMILVNLNKRISARELLEDEARTGEAEAATHTHGPVHWYAPEETLNMPRGFRYLV